MKKFYGFEYADGRNTTSGEVNTRTGRMNRAGWAMVFSSQAARRDWIDEGPQKYGDDQRVSVSRRKLRALCAGMDLMEFDEMINYM